MKNKTVLITGTSSGIGRETAKFFAQNGWNVAATVRKKEDFFFIDDYSSARNFLLDISREDQCKKIIEEVVETFGSLDVLINNAGLAIMGAFEESNPESINNQLQTNFLGAVHLTRHVLPHFRKQSGGLIVSVSSMAGRVGVPFHAIHSASKFALEGFFESLRYEVYPFGIRIKLIEPGSYQSRIHAHQDDYKIKPIPNAYDPYLRKYQEGMDQYESNRRSPVEVAEKIWEAVTDKSDRLRYIVGSDALAMDKVRKESGDEQIFSMMGKNFQ